MKRSHLSSLLILALIFAAAAVMLPFAIGAQDAAEAEVEFAAGFEPDMQAAAGETAVNAPALPYLDSTFCANGLCPAGQWSEWVIVESDADWSAEELALLRETLIITIGALDEAGFDGRALLSGYRFGRHHGQYTGADGRIARVNHTSREVILADTAFDRMWGFYIYHELGHIIDRALDSEPRRRFHEIIGSDLDGDSPQTADGYWMNEHARTNPGESAADAIALWIVIRHTDNPLPVYWMMPNDTDYAAIAAAMEEALSVDSER